MKAKIIDGPSASPSIFDSARRMPGGHYLAWLLPAELETKDGARRPVPVIFAEFETYQIDLLNRLLTSGADMAVTPYLRFQTYERGAGQAPATLATVRLVWAPSLAQDKPVLETRWICILPQTLDDENQRLLFDVLLDEAQLVVNLCTPAGKAAVVEVAGQFMEFAVDIVLTPEHHAAIRDMRDRSAGKRLAKENEVVLDVLAMSQRILDDVDIEREFFPPLDTPQ